MIIENLMTVLFAFLLLVILLNMLIALLSNMYQQVVDSTEREFSRLVFTDYYQNTPNEYYSAMDHVPMFLSIFMLVIVPFIIFFKSKKLNKILNIGIYIIKFFIPFIICYYVILLLLTPLTYIKILWSILRNNYTN